MTTYSGAIDTMYGVFKTSWDSGASPIIGYTPGVDYDDEDNGQLAKLDQAFARVTLRNLSEGQIGMGEAGGGAKLHETLGVLIMQVFVPRKDNQGATTARALAVLVRDAFREAGAGGDVWFKNATILEQPLSIRWRQININVEYDFTETT